ncbi:MAG: N-6 DNA methylase, partial [Candidatus Sumerlaeota bacterium]|nr:N-6 DNA methylase [Candidatus Sumerlaeota bacterium]
METTSSSSLLHTAYSQLDFADLTETQFLPASRKSSDFSTKTWTDKGDWLALASEVGAEKVFFLENNPVIIFAHSDTDDECVLKRLYHRIWSMARPRLLFLARPGELAVYDLAHKPPKPKDEFRKFKPLAIAHTTAQVAENLKRFRREEIESGRVFKLEERFGKDLNQRADKALIHDLKLVRKELIERGLGGINLKHAHALIGRSIFIRYLEDRGILTEQYFRNVAGKHKKGMDFLSQKSPLGLILEEDQHEPIYPRILLDHSFTYALFGQLASDFNGDMFPDITQESNVVKQSHLDLIRDWMYGDAGIQKKLFFYAYRFKIVPIELISSIYEEFYHEESGKESAHGAFYTPPALAEFVLSQTLTTERLKNAPRILDPACGSGIFLVEAFRRIVRYRIVTQKRRLRFDELKKILRDQLAGIDINPEAVRIAAFSLYLAMLHYLEPPDILEQIRQGNRLPYLVADDRKPGSFNCLVSANAFDTAYFDNNPSLKTRFSSECADVVVGNPPWGSPGKESSKAREQNQYAVEWCVKRELPIGDRESSQAFIWRALDCLKPHGIAGLLVSTGVFYKHHPKSIAFRQKWLDGCQLTSVFNFAHARQVFFSSVISPFAAVFFHKRLQHEKPYAIHYWSAKRTRILDGLQAIIFSANDCHPIMPEEDCSNYKIWKTLWWGNHRDWHLVSYLMNFDALSSLISSKGQGYIVSNKAIDANWLQKYKVLPKEHFYRYGPLDMGNLYKPPDRVYRRGTENIYNGLRLLVGRGIEEDCQPKGRIIARVEDKSFAFTNAIHGIKLHGLNEDKYKILLGILWSSLARYFFFMTTSNWGNWHNEIELDDELLSMPICYPKDTKLSRRIINIVDQLREHAFRDDNLIVSAPNLKIMTRERCQKLEAELDAAVFELYGLGD